MDGVSAGSLRRGDNRRDVEVALAGGRRPDAVRFVGIAHVERRPVGIGIDGRCAQAAFAARPQDADGDFASVGDQDSTEHE